jgi:hypothetical protein
MSWIKKELGYIKDSFSQIINGTIVFFLASSGLLCALYLRYLNLNGTLISFVSIFVEILALALTFFILKKHIITKEEKKEESSNTKKFK